MPVDAWGLQYTAVSRAAVDAFDRTLDAYLAFGRDTGPRLKETFGADPTMLDGACVARCVLQVNGIAGAHAEGEREPRRGTHSRIRCESTRALAQGLGARDSGLAPSP